MTKRKVYPLAFTTDDAGRLMKEAVADVKQLVEGYRADAPEGAKVLAYTKRQHWALRRMFEFVVALTYSARDCAHRRIDQLENRIKELEASQTKYEGIWEAGKAYRKGTLVTHSGSIFHANTDSPLKPGTPNSGWQLAVKRGKDAKPNGHERGFA